ncbi:hypothetical protein P5V15_002018 [Pogonomyrmex californicus]
MNVILIPFFLAARMVVNDTSEWTFGPEYSYDLNITYVIKSDPHEPINDMQLISTIKCRPKMSNSLFCHLNNSTYLQLFKNHTFTREVTTEQMFEIKFNNRGVEGLIIEPPTRMDVVNILRKIATQFNIVVDPITIRMSQYMNRENSSMGDCATTYRITHEETDMPEKEDKDFQLVVMPLIDAELGTLSIEKSRKRCINAPRYVDFSTGILKMGRFISKIQIDPDKFETFTEFDGKISLLSESEHRRLSFKEIIQINLNGIEPARGELPTLFYGEMIDLNTNNDIPSNFIN